MTGICPDPAPSLLPAATDGDRYALRPGVHAAELSGGLRLFAWPHAGSVGAVDDGLRAVLAALAGPPRDGDDLQRVAGVHGTPAAAVVALLDRLAAGGWLAVTATGDGGRPLWTVRPLKPPPAPPPAAPALRLSRFALARRDGADVVVEAPAAAADLVVHDPAVLATLVGGTGSAVPVARLHRDARRCGLLAAPDEDTAFRTRQWSPHELWFHERSRLHHRGYLGSGFGGTFWARDTFPPVPARPPAYPGRPVRLPVPDLEHARRTDPSLTDVLEDRRSLREHDDAAPISLGQLGELLYRCARTRVLREVDGVEYTSRPHPSGGSVYELEIYPVVRHAAGLAAGMYHYDSHDHVLRPVAAAHDPAVRRLLRVAQHGSATGNPPQVLLTVSARVGRLMWKYEQMAYSLALKHVGVLQQTLCCAATAMGLAACPLGGGDADAFSVATGRDPLTECSVGELALGSVAA